MKNTLHMSLGVRNTELANRPLEALARALLYCGQGEGRNGLIILIVGAR